MGSLTKIQLCRQASLCGVPSACMATPRRDGHAGRSGCRCRRSRCSESTASAKTRSGKKRVTHGRTTIWSSARASAPRLTPVTSGANSGRSTAAAGIGQGWTPQELRHTFVSLLSATGTPVEGIARLAGHSSTRTTEVIYRRELRPVLTRGAEAMDAILS